MVGVAQLAEHRTVAPDVVGSIPISHPIKSNGCRHLQSLLQSPYRFGDCDPRNLLARFPRFIAYRVTVDVHRGANVGVSHKLLLNADWSTDPIEPGTVRVAERMRADVADSSLLTSLVQCKVEFL